MGERDSGSGRVNSAGNFATFAAIRRASRDR
jgi:hypothetical protein